MKKWSLTHLDTGPMPCERMTSAPALAISSYDPAANEQPKQQLVLIAKLLVSVWTTSPGHWDGCNGMV